MAEIFTLDGARTHHLIRAVRGIGIEIPEHVEKELGLYKRVQDSERAANAAVLDAQSTLYGVDPKDWDTASADLSEAITAAFTLSNGLTGKLIEIASNRLVQATYHYTGEWIADIVDKLNEIVDDTRWNEHVGNLPTFNQIVHVLDLTAEQGAAVGACREAAAQFDPYWAVLKQLMAVEGHSTGESREPSENLDLFFTLSDGTWGQATGAVPLMVGASQGTDSAREFRPLMPYIYPALVGAELNFATPDVASLRRSEVQGGGRPTQQYLSAALSGAY